MAPFEEDPGERIKLAEGPGDRERSWNRSPRRELRLPLRYRLEGREEWYPGETVNVSESGLLFSSNELLEIDARVEITFQTTGTLLLQSSSRQALVVRRMLSNWPETRLLFGARYRA